MSWKIYTSDTALAGSYASLVTCIKEVFNKYFNGDNWGTCAESSNSIYISFNEGYSLPGFTSTGSAPYIYLYTSSSAGSKVTLIVDEDKQISVCMPSYAGSSANIFNSSYFTGWFMWKTENGQFYNLTNYGKGSTTSSGLSATYYMNIGTREVSSITDTDYYFTLLFITKASPAVPDKFDGLYVSTNGGLVPFGGKIVCDEGTFVSVFDGVIFVKEDEIESIN